MQMTDSEIVKNYKDSKNKKGQIQILADLNTCKPDDIRKILKDNGVDLRGGNYHTKAAAEPVPEEKQFKKMTEQDVKKMIEIPEEQVKTNEENRVKLPKIVRETLQDDLDWIETQLHELVEKKITIKTFLENND